MMSEKKSRYDVIVVGAGPAGSVAAYYLARHRLRVLLIDQQQFPRYKPCGGAIPMHTIRELPFDLKPTLELCVPGSILTFKGKPVLKISLEEEYVWLAMRDRMDAFLLEKAREAGAETLTGVRVLKATEDEQQVKVHTPDQIYTGAYLIGADGVNSIIARSFDLLPDRRTGIALEAEIAVPEEALRANRKFAAFDFGAIPNGYGWVFPKQDHLSVGVFQANGAKAHNLKADLQQYINLLPLLEKHEILHMQGHHIPLGGQNGALHTRRCLLVGDAANLADPWLGEGIYYAVRSANIAAAVLAAAVQGEENELSAYTRQIHAEITGDFRFAKRIGDLVYRHPVLAMRLISRSSVLQRDVFSTIRGDFTFRQLWRRLQRQMPLILVQALFHKSQNLS